MDKERFLAVIGILADKISVLEYQLESRDEEIRKLNESNDALKDAVKTLERCNHSLRNAKGE